MKNPPHREKQHINYFEKKPLSGQSSQTSSINIVESEKSSTQVKSASFQGIAQGLIRLAAAIIIIIITSLFCTDLLKAGSPGTAAATLAIIIILLFGIAVTGKWPKFLKLPFLEIRR